MPIVLAAVLALTSIPMHLAARAAQARDVGRAWLLVLAALIVQTGYFAYQVHDFGDQLERADRPQRLHLDLLRAARRRPRTRLRRAALLGLWLLARLAGGLTTYRVNATRAIAWYWHFVNVLTLVVTAVLLSARA